MRSVQPLFVHTHRIQAKTMLLVIAHDPLATAGSLVSSLLGLSESPPSGPCCTHFRRHDSRPQRPGGRFAWWECVSERALMV